MIGKLLRIRYEVNQALVEGPVFRAYTAHDRVQAKDVCIRTFQSPFDAEKPFVAAVGEAVQKLSQVKHPGVERLIEMDDDEGVPFLVGEFSQGSVLTERIKRFAPFSVPVSAAMAVSIAEALASLHREGIVHGDLGAHNVIVSPDGTCRLQLAGIWKAYSASQTAGVVVLPSMAPYLAPEVSQGAMPSPASDVYSLGIILFQLLTGRLPYLAEQPVAVAMKHLNEQPPALRALNPSVPTALEEVVRKAMSKEAGQRYESAEAMLGDLRMVQDALRFGKSVGWPPKATGAEPQQPVAPQLSGIQGERKEESRFQARNEPADEEPEQVPGDVPAWLRMILAFFIALVVFMVGGWMIFNLQKQRIVKVPDVRGLTLAEGESRLKSLNLVMHPRGEVSEKPANMILDSDPSPGSEVKEGQSVAVIYSKGSEYVEVPDIRGITPDKAKEMLDTLGLKLNDRVLEVRDRSADPGTIVSQLPEPRQRVIRGSSVRVRIASASGKTETDPDSGRRYEYTIRIELSDTDSPVMLRIDMTDSRSTKTILEEEHGPGDEVTVTAEGYGPQADFRIFYDGELVKQVTKHAKEDQPAREN